MKLLSCAFVTLMISVAFAEKRPLSHYQSVIDRQMFGPVPADFDPTKSPADVTRSSSSAAQRELTKEQELLQSSVVFSIINVTPEGETAVGFTDNADPKSPKHYYLKVGEMKDGWMVKEADAAEASMTIVKDEIEVSLKIGDNSAKGGGATAKSGVAAAKPSLGRVAGGALLGNSLRSRRRMLRQQDEAAAAAEAAAAEQKEAERQAQAAADKAERDAERELQRQQLQAIQEDLRKVREQRQRESSESAEKDENNDA